MKLGSSAWGLTGLYGTSLLVSFGRGMSIPTIPVLATAFDVSVGAAVQVVTAYGVGRLAGTLPSGLIVDRLGTRVALVAGPVLIGAAALTVGLAPTFLIVIAAILGIMTLLIDAYLVREARKFVTVGSKGSMNRLTAERPGLFEIEIGTCTLREIIEESFKEGLLGQ